MPNIKARRDETKYRLLPPLDAETYAGLRANIAVNGIQVPVVRDEKGFILDGFARAKIAEELGYECLSVTVKGLSEQEKRSQVRASTLPVATWTTPPGGRSSPTRSSRTHTGRTAGSPSRWASMTRPLPASDRECIQLRRFRSCTSRSALTGSTAPPPEAAWRRTGMGDPPLSVPMPENVNTSISMMKKPSSGLPPRSGSDGSLRSSGRSRRSASNHALCASRSVAVPCCTAIAST